MVVLPERHSAQPGPGVCQEHVVEVLVCQHGHLHLLAGAGLHPTQEAGTSWHPQSRFSQSESSISRSPVSVLMSLNDASADLPLCKQTTSCYYEAKVEIGTA